MAATASLAFTADRDRSRAFEGPSTGVAGSESPSSEKPLKRLKLLLCFFASQSASERVRFPPAE